VPKAIKIKIKIRFINLIETTSNPYVIYCINIFIVYYTCAWRVCQGMK
jgi:hypothetical protein